MQAYNWLVSLHVIFMVTWFAGLFYLPRLFVYHAMAEDALGHERFKVMERKLFYGIMTPGGVITLAFGTSLLALIPGYLQEPWMHFKLTLVALLVLYHIWCGKLVHDFRHDLNRRDHTWYRWFNEVPVPLLVGIVVLVVNRSVSDALIAIAVVLAIFLLTAIIGLLRARRRVDPG